MEWRQSLKNIKSYLKALDYYWQATSYFWCFFDLEEWQERDFDEASVTKKPMGKSSVVGGKGSIEKNREAPALGV